MKSKRKHPLFLWRDQILKSDLHATTRHVLITLSLHMNLYGKSCFPSTKTLESESGLSERTVCTHLIKAEKLKWIKRTSKRGEGKNWRRNEYEISFPNAEVVYVSINTKGTFTQVAELVSVATDEGDEAKAKNTYFKERKELKEVLPNSSVISQK